MDRAFKRVLVDIDENYLEALHAVRGDKSFTEALNAAIYAWITEETKNQNVTPAGKF